MKKASIVWLLFWLVTSCAIGANTLATSATTKIADADRLIIYSGTVTDVSGGSIIVGPEIDASANGLAKKLIVIDDASSPSYGVAIVTANTLDSITYSPAAPFAVTTGDTVRVFAISPQLADVFAKLPSKAHFAGSNISTGDIEMDDASGNFSGSVGSVTGSVGSIGTDGITAASIADNAIDEGAIAAGAIANGTEATGWNDLSTTQANAEVDAALADINLDHFMKNAPAGGEITSNSALAKLAASDGNWTSFVNTDDSLQAQRENIDAIFDGAPTFAEAMDEHGYTTGRAEKIDKLAPLLLLNTTINGNPASNTSLVLTDGPPDDDALNGALVVITDESEPTQKSVGLVKNYDQATKTLTLVTDPEVFTFADGDQVEVIATGSPAALWLGGSP